MHVWLESFQSIKLDHLQSTECWFILILFIAIIKKKFLLIHKIWFYIGTGQDFWLLTIWVGKNHFYTNNLKTIYIFVLFKLQHDSVETHWIVSERFCAYVLQRDSPTWFDIRWMSLTDMNVTWWRCAMFILRHK